MKTLDEFRAFLNTLNSDHLGLAVHALYVNIRTRSGRRIGAFRFPGDEPLTVVFAGGPEWSIKVAKLYEAWYAREINNSWVPVEGELPEPRRDDLIAALVDTLDVPSAHALIDLLLEKLCQSSLDLKAHQMLESRLSEKLLELRKSVKAVPLLEVRDASSTKSSSESD